MARVGRIKARKTRVGRIRAVGRVYSIGCKSKTKDREEQ